MFNLPDYWNRQLLNGFAAKRYARLLFRGKQYVESPELNELQDLTFGRLAAVGNAALGAISLREGGAIVIEPGDGHRAAERRHGLGWRLHAFGAGHDIEQCSDGRNSCDRRLPD